jgi:hypothetical protein
MGMQATVSNKKTQKNTKNLGLSIGRATWKCTSNYKPFFLTLVRGPTYPTDVELTKYPPSIRTLEHCGSSHV